MRCCYYIFVCLKLEMNTLHWSDKYQPDTVSYVLSSLTVVIHDTLNVPYCRPLHNAQVVQKLWPMGS